jgi:hypothetical protein
MTINPAGTSDPLADAAGQDLTMALGRLARECVDDEIPIPESEDAGHSVLHLV